MTFPTDLVSRPLPAGPRIAVLGAGAIGGFLGGMMAKDGHDVTLIDQWPYTSCSR